MRFYPKTHTHYCRIDLHAKTMHLCILDRGGATLLREGMLPEAYVYPTEIGATRVCSAAASIWAAAGRTIVSARSPV